MEPSALPAKEIPPWLSLPQDVRERVMERFKQITGHSPENSLADIDPTRSLMDLGISRLIEMFKGDIKSAIRYAHANASKPQLYSVKVSDWIAADRRAKALLKRVINDPSIMAEGLLLHQLAAEEMLERN